MPPFDKLGEYAIVNELGKGGMGVVYKARQESLDRLVALKVLPESLTENPEFVSRFVREAKAAAHMVHPNVIQIYSVGEDKGVHYYAMEYVEGEDLSKKLRGGYQPTWEESTDIVMDVAKALSCAEEAGIVHRDIKPANVMFDKRDQVKVMDFGLAKAFSEQTVMVTQPGMVVGTVAYMSPEQGRGEDLDGRADQYSLGVMYYELLTGKLPFKGDSPTSIIYMHIHEAPPPPRSLNPTIPEAAEQVVLRMLAKKREDRYPNAKTLIEDLKAVKRNTAAGATMMFAASAASAHEEHGTEKTMILSGGPGPVKKRKGFAGVGIAAGALVAGVVGYLALGPGSKKPGDGEPEVPAASVPAKITVDLAEVLRPLGLVPGDVVTLEGETLPDWTRKLELADRNHRLTVKRKYYLPEELQVLRGEPPRLNKTTLALLPDEPETLAEVGRRLAESEADGNPPKALAALAETDAFVMGIFKTLENERYKAAKDRHYAYWKARQNEAEGSLEAAEAVLTDPRVSLNVREKDYLDEIRKKRAEKAASAVPPARPPSDPPAAAREFDVSLDFVLPTEMPQGVQVFVDGQELPPGPPWKARLKTGSRQLVLQAPFFRRMNAALRIGSEGTPSVPSSLKWEADVPAVMNGVRERLAQEVKAAGDEERLEKRLDLVAAARAFAQGVFQTAGASEITDDGIRRLLGGQEAYLRAALVWRDGKGSAQEALEVLSAAAPGTLDREGEDLLRRLRQETGQKEMSYLVERVRDRLKRGLLDDPDLAQSLEELQKHHGKDPEVKALRNQVDEARVMRNEVDGMVEIKQFGLAHEKLSELIAKHCPDSSVLRARLASIEQARDSDEGAKAQTKRKIDEVMRDLEEARRKDDAKAVSDLAAKVLQLDPAHAQAAAYKAEADAKLFESAARAQIDGTLDRLGRLFQRSGGGKDKDEYQTLFTPEGWAAQVERKATLFFDSPLIVAASQFDNAVTQVDAKAGAATTTMDWVVTAKYGAQEVPARFPVAFTWKLVNNAWRIDKIEEKTK